MHNIWVIGRREYTSHFNSATAYTVAFMIFLSLGIIFYASLVQVISFNFTPGVQIVIGPLITILLFTSPGITMKSLAEEQKSGTLELLMTAPVKDWELIVGKWLGCFLFLVTITFATIIFPAILNLLIIPGLDTGTVASNYVGLVFFVSATAAIGVAVSSFFSNQVAAYFATLGVLLALWMISFSAQNNAGVSGSVLQFISITNHFSNSFYKGVVELKDIIYYLSLTVLALFVGYVSIDSRRWR